MSKKLHSTVDVQKMYDHTKVCSQPGASDEDLIYWITEVQGAKAVDLVALTSRLSSGEEKESRN